MSGWNVGLGAAARKGCEEKQQKKKKRKGHRFLIWKSSMITWNSDCISLNIYTRCIMLSPSQQCRHVWNLQECVHMVFEDRSSKAGGLNIYYTFYFTTSHSWTQTIATSSRRQGWLHMSGCHHRHASLLKSGLKQIKRMAKVTGQMRELSFRVPIRIEMEAVVRWWVKGAERDKKKNSVTVRISMW